jgi:hypothetical protein
MIKSRGFSLCPLSVSTDFPILSMIYYFIPYSLEKKLLRAIDDCFNLLQDDDWAVLMDGDIMFLRSDFGRDIQEYIKLFPETALFTCYASRCHYSCQVRSGTDMDNDSILYHKEQADRIHDELHLKVKRIQRKIAGHLMVMKKSTWLRIRERVFTLARDKEILGVDTKISQAIMEKGMIINLMRGIYVMHYLRLKSGFGDKSHLK